MPVAAAAAVQVQRDLRQVGIDLRAESSAGTASYAASDYASPDGTPLAALYNGDVRRSVSSADASAFSHAQQLTTTAAETGDGWGLSGAGDTYIQTEHSAGTSSARAFSETLVWFEFALTEHVYRYEFSGLLNAIGTSGATATLRSTGGDNLLFDFDVALTGSDLYTASGTLTPGNYSLLIGATAMLSTDLEPGFHNATSVYNFGFELRSVPLPGAGACLLGGLLWVRRRRSRVALRPGNTETTFGRD